MAGDFTFKIDSTEFQRTIREYARVSSHTPAEICNKKAYYIARKAIWFTHKANFGQMADELGQFLRVITSKSRFGTLTSRGQGQHNSADLHPAPLLALIINKRRGDKGLPGLYGKAMRDEFRKVFGARARSIGFIKSGWIAAREAFKKWGGGNKGLPPSERDVKQVGQPKGGATIAKEGIWKCEAILWNGANAKHDQHGDSIYEYGMPGLEKAVQDETQSMAEEIERRLREAAQKVGIKTN